MLKNCDWELCVDALAQQFGADGVKGREQMLRKRGKVRETKHV